MSKGLCHALLCSLPGTGGDAGLHPAPLLNPAPAGHKAALSIERGCEHSQGGGEGPELLLRPADVRSPLPLRHPCNVHAMPLQCSCSTLGVAALVAARSWVQLQGQNNISHTWCLCGEPLINLAMKFGVMNYI